MRFSKDYVYGMIDALRDRPIARFMIPDTLGVLAPDECYAFCREMVERYPELHFDFHAHNDYDLAVANVMAAVKAGVRPSTGWGSGPATRPCRALRLC